MRSIGADGPDAPAAIARANGRIRDAPILDAHT
jgi:hypothetical protein